MASASARSGVRLMLTMEQTTRDGLLASRRFAHIRSRLPGGAPSLIHQIFRRMEVFQVAQQVTVRLVDDFDGAEASSTVEFGLDGRGYLIDLSDDNAAQLRDALAPFVGAGRKPGGRRRSAAPSGGARPVDREHNLAVRAWANENGWDVAERGRITASVLEAYENRNQAAAKKMKKAS